MVAARNYNMLNFRAMHGRKKTHAVSEKNYTCPNCTFGRCPIVIHLGDFLQLAPTAALGLITDVNATNEDDSYVLAEPPDLETQSAIAIFRRIPSVIELHGTKRFVANDPIIAMLECMRLGKMPPEVWNAFKETWAQDSSSSAELDQRHKEPRFLEGYGMSMYWETLARWITRRARRDARVLGHPVVCIQAADECQTLDKDAYTRLLAVANIYKTGKIHGVFTAHVGMRVRFTGKFNAKYGLVQEQTATIVDFVFDPEDEVRYRQAKSGALFSPNRVPTGLWLQVDNLTNVPGHQKLSKYVSDENLARGLYCMPLTEAEFGWETSNVTHTVKRFGFMLTHANYLTATASQGQTIRAAVTIDCARNAPRGRRGTGDDEWWLNLYVMFSRVTQMKDMLLLRPPEREFLERGPPPALRKALLRFATAEKETVTKAEEFAIKLDLTLPDF